MPKPASKDETGSGLVPSTKISQFQQFTTETVHRSALKNAVYNPRHIAEKNKLKLREGIKNLGLVQPLVWNKRTGNLVGGHQRISQMDALEGTKDYCLTVAVVDVDEVRERELNVLLNNTDVSGEWELDKLKDLLTGEDIDLFHTGFDNAAFMQMFGEAASQPADQHGDGLNEKVTAMKETFAKLETDNQVKDDQDFYNVVVFGCYADRLAFLKQFGLDDNRYVDGRTLAGIMQAMKDKLAILQATAGMD